MISTDILASLKALVITSGIATANVSYDREDDIPADKLPYARLHTEGTQHERYFKGTNANFHNVDTVNIEFFGKRTAAKSAQEILHDLVGAARAQIEADTTLSSTVKDCEITKTEYETEGSRDDVYGRATLTYEVTYITTAGADI